MALLASEIATEVQSELGKVSDTVQVTSTRCLRWLNQSIKDIIYKYPGIRDVHILDKTTWKCQADVYEYDTRDFLQYPIAHIHKMKYVDTGNTDYGWIYPYPGGLDQWDADYPYVPDAGTGIPSSYVRRGNMVEVIFTPGSNEDGNPLWVEYDYIPADIASTASPVLTNFDEVLIQWVKSYALRLLGRSNDSTECRQYAEYLAVERLNGDEDSEDSEEMPDNGP